MEIDKKFSKKVLDLINEGLCRGTGNGTPGNMCVNAAVAYAMNEDPQTFDPSCVSPEVRALGVELNDLPWPSNKARADGMRRLAIAQLGTRSDVCTYHPGESGFMWRVRSLMKEACRKYADENGIPVKEDTWRDYSLTVIISTGKLGREHTHALLKVCADAMADELVRMETPGSKFLCLLDPPKENTKDQ